VNQTMTTELSFPIKTSAIDSEKDGYDVKHDATEEERGALATRFGLVGLPAFRFTANVKPTRSENGFRLRGRIIADVIQTCVATLDPVTAHIDQPFEILLFDETDDRAAPIDIEEDYETFSDDLIELGEIAAIELALSLDPYPRVPGAKGDKTGPGADTGESPGGRGADQERENPTHRPFEGLAALRRNR